MTTTKISDTSPAARTNQQAGFTLVEVLAAMTIFAIAATGLAATTIATIHSNATSRNMSTATSLAQDRIEQFRALDVTVAAERAQLVNDDLEGVEGADRVDAAGNPSLTGPFRRSWVVTNVVDADGNIEVGVVRVDVTVEWADPSPRSLVSVAYVCVTNLC